MAGVELSPAAAAAATASTAFECAFPRSEELLLGSVLGGAVGARGEAAAAVGVTAAVAPELLREWRGDAEAAGCRRTEACTEGSGMQLNLARPFVMLRAHSIPRGHDLIDTHCKGIGRVR